MTIKMSVSRNYVKSGALESARKNKCFCDVEIIGEDEVAVDAHRIILAVGSKYFYNLFKTNQYEDEIRIDNVNGETIEKMIMYMYTERPIEVNGENCVRIYKAAKLFQIPEIMAMVSDYFALPLNVQTFPLNEKQFNEALEMAKDLHVMELEAKLVIFCKVAAFKKNEPIEIEKMTSDEICSFCVQVALEKNETLRIKLEYLLLNWLEANKSNVDVYLKCVKNLKEAVEDSPPVLSLQNGFHQSSNKDNEEKDLPMSQLRKSRRLESKELNSSISSLSSSENSPTKRKSRDLVNDQTMRLSPENFKSPAKSISKSPTKSSLKSPKSFPVVSDYQLEFPSLKGKSLNPTALEDPHELNLAYTERIEELVKFKRRKVRQNVNHHGNHHANKDPEMLEMTKFFFSESAMNNYKKNYGDKEMKLFVFNGINRIPDLQINAFDFRELEETKTSDKMELNAFFNFENPRVTQLAYKLKQTEKHHLNSVDRFEKYAGSCKNLEKLVLDVHFSSGNFNELMAPNKWNKLHSLVLKIYKSSNFPSNKSDGSKWSFIKSIFKRAPKVETFTFCPDGEEEAKQLGKILDMFSIDLKSLTFENPNLAGRKDKKVHFAWSRPLQILQSVRPQISLKTLQIMYCEDFEPILSYLDLAKFIATQPEIEVLDVQFAICDLSEKDKTKYYKLNSSSLKFNAGEIIVDVTTGKDGKQYKSICIPPLLNLKEFNSNGIFFKFTPPIWKNFPSLEIIHLFHQEFPPMVLDFGKLSGFEFNKIEEVEDLVTVTELHLDFYYTTRSKILEFSGKSFKYLKSLCIRICEKIAPTMKAFYKENFPCLAIIEFEFTIKSKNQYSKFEEILTGIKVEVKSEEVDGIINQAGICTEDRSILKLQKLEIFTLSIVITDLSLLSLKFRQFLTDVTGHSLCQLPNLSKFLLKIQYDSSPIKQFSQQCAAEMRRKFECVFEELV